VEDYPGLCCVAPATMGFRYFRTLPVEGKTGNRFGIQGGMRVPTTSRQQRHAHFSLADRGHRRKDGDLLTNRWCGLWRSLRRLADIRISRASGVGLVERQHSYDVD